MGERGEEGASVVVGWLIGGWAAGVIHGRGVGIDRKGGGRKRRGRGGRIKVGGGYKAGGGGSGEDGEEGTEGEEGGKGGVAGEEWGEVGGWMGMAEEAGESPPFFSRG